MAWRKVGLLKRVARLVQSRGKSRPLAVALPMERLVLNQDTVGHVGLELTALPNWKSFERYEEELLRKLDGHVVEKGLQRRHAPLERRNRESPLAHGIQGLP